MILNKQENFGIISKVKDLLSKDPRIIAYDVQKQTIRIRPKHMVIGPYYALRKGAPNKCGRKTFKIRYTVEAVEKLLSELDYCFCTDCLNHVSRYIWNDVKMDRFMDLYVKAVIQKFPKRTEL